MKSKLMLGIIVLFQVIAQASTIQNDQQFCSNVDLYRQNIVPVSGTIQGYAELPNGNSMFYRHFNAGE